MKELVFYYDIVCPFAYMTSRVIENLARRNGAKLRWKPVLLGGLYKATGGPAHSAYDEMAPAKLKIQADDIRRTVFRNGIDLKQPLEHPIKTLKPMRLLAAAAEHNEGICAKLTHKLFAAYWVHNKDVRNSDVLQENASSIAWNVNVDDVITDPGKELLLNNTKEAVDKGAFGVPSFSIDGQFYFGTDRLHFVEHALGNTMALPSRLCYPSPRPSKAKLTIYHDFSSPWSYVGARQITKLMADVQPVSVEVEWVPIVVGALFKKIGTPVIPAEAICEAKMKYMMKDLDDTCRFHGIQFKYTSHFPIHSVLPLRVSLVHPDEKLRQIIYESIWRFDKNASDPEVLSEILSEAGFDGESLIKETQKASVKEQLKINTERAYQAGLCGVPSYQVNDGAVVWGQDRLNIVADMLCGWKDVPVDLTSKL